MLEITEVRNADGTDFNYLSFRDLRAVIPKTELINVTAYDKWLDFRGMAKDLPVIYDTFTVMHIESDAGELRVFLTDQEVIK